MQSWFLYSINSKLQIKARIWTCGLNSIIWCHVRKSTHENNVIFWNQTRVKPIIHDHFLLCLLNHITLPYSYLCSWFISTFLAVDKFKKPQCSNIFSTPTLSTYSPMDTHAVSYSNKDFPPSVPAMMPSLTTSFHV